MSFKSTRLQRVVWNDSKSHCQIWPLAVFLDVLECERQLTESSERAPRAKVHIVIPCVAWLTINSRVQSVTNCKDVRFFEKNRLLNQI